MVRKDGQRADSVENFLQQNALSPSNPLGNIGGVAVFGDGGDTTETETASIVSSSIQGINLNFNTNKTRKLRHGLVGSFGPGQDNAGRSSKQGMGRGKLRRYRNNLGLLSGIDEEESLEANVAAEIAQENISVFSELFDDPSKMTIWQNFIKMPEVDQREFLLSVAADFDEAADDDYEYGNIESGGLSVSAEECFKRIDQKLRRLVAHRSPPVDIIEPMEVELTQFFNQQPEGVLQVEKPDIYHRMIFHAICQYFGLLTKSVKDKSTCRTRVTHRAKKGRFRHPSKLLSVYLCEKYMVC